MEAYSHLKFELRIEELLNHTLNKYGKDSQTRLNQTIKSENFQKFVRQPVEKISVERKKSLYNLNDFWNGLIP